jgi:hypothetical protein
LFKAVVQEQTKRVFGAGFGFGEMGRRAYLFYG